MYMFIYTTLYTDSKDALYLPQDLDAVLWLGEYLDLDIVYFIHIYIYTYIHMYIIPTLHTHFIYRTLFTTGFGRYVVVGRVSGSGHCVLYTYIYIHMYVHT